jgi:uncharacterized repeat protein (TIGR02543 family)
MKNGSWRSRFSEAVALVLSIIMVLNPLAVSAQGLVEPFLVGGIGSVLSMQTGNWSISGGDVSQGGVYPGDVTGGNIPPGDVTGGDVSQGDVLGLLVWVFPDESLAISVMNALGKDNTFSTVSTNELNSINSLTVGGVTDWTGIELLPNLHHVNVLRTKGYDIKNLAGLKDVQELSLEVGVGGELTDNMTGDIAVFGDFADLRYLSIGAELEVYGTLSSLPSTLTGFWIHEQVDEISGKITGSLDDLVKMKNLEYLGLWDKEEITGSLSTLQSFSKLIELGIGGTEVTGSLADLSEMTQLHTLYLGDFNTITGSLSDIAGLTNLTEFVLVNNRYVSTEVTGDIKVFQDFTKLELLELNGISAVTGDVADLTGLGKLNILNLPWTNVYGDLSKLSGLKLGYICLAGTQVTGELSDLKAMPLRGLIIEASQLTGNLSDLGQQDELEELNLAWTAIQVKPEDKNLFPKLAVYDDLFMVPVVDEEKSQLTYQVGDWGNFIQIVTNKSVPGFARLLVDGAEVMQYPFPEESDLAYYGYDDELDDQNNLVAGYLNIWDSYLETLTVGEHVATLVFNWGGEVSTTFTVEDSRLTVKFLGSNGELLDEQEVFPGETAEAPEVPEVDGYTFSGWDKDFTNITANLTVTAQYSQNMFTVTFKDWDGTVIAANPVGYGSAATAPQEPTRVGYTFTGWDKDFTNIKTDLIVTAQYSINQYTVTFRDEDGTVLDAQRVTYGEAAQAPAAPIHTGAGFLDWDVAFDNVTQDLVVTAKYQANMFTVTFLDAEDMGSTELAKQTVAYGKPATAPEEPSHQGYEFIGWDKGFASITADTTVTAKYHLLSGSSHEINEPGTVDGTTLEDFGDIIIKAEGVTLIGGNLDGNVRVEAKKAVLKDLTIAGSVYLTAEDTTMTDSKVEGSLTASAASISLRNLTISGNLSIGATNITLVGGTVGGNLTIERSVGNGHVEISDVTAKETIMYVRGGGKNSIVITDSLFGAIVVDKKAEAGQDAVRVAVQGTTAVANTIVNSAAIIEDTTEEGDGIQNVTLAKEIPAASTVELRGTIKEVTVQKEELKVVNNAVVEKLQVEAPSLTLINNATVAELKVEENIADTKVEGEKINNIVLAEGSEEPVFVPTPEAPTQNNDNDDDNDDNGGKSSNDTVAAIPTENKEDAELKSPATKDRDVSTIAWLACISTAFGVLGYRKSQKKEKRK